MSDKPFEITVNQKEYSAKLAGVSRAVAGRAVAGRSTLPVLGNILHAAGVGMPGDEGYLILAATNLELWITARMKCEQVAPGQTTLPAKTLIDLVNTLPDGTLRLKLNERTQTTNLTLAKSITANIKGIDAQEFPLVPRLNPAQAWACDGAEWREMVKRVLVAAAKGEERPLLTGILLTVDGDEISLIASDSFRLALDARKLPKGKATTLTALIPARALAELNRLVGDTLQIEFRDGRAIFLTGDYQLASQLIEGEFPGHRKAIPTRYTTRTVIPTAEFIKACKSVDIFARESAHSGRILIKPGTDTTPGTLTLSGSSAETGDNVVELDVSVDGAPVEIDFNLDFLLDGLNGIDTPNVILETTAPTSPGLLKPNSDSGFRYVIMPISFGK